MQAKGFSAFLGKVKHTGRHRKRETTERERGVAMPAAGSAYNQRALSILPPEVL